MTQQVEHGLLGWHFNKSPQDIFEEKKKEKGWMNCLDVDGKCGAINCVVW